MDAKLPFAVTESSFEPYLKDYRLTLAAFLKYIAVFEEDMKNKDIPQNINLKLEYYFNEMELKLLIAAKYMIVTKVEWLFDSEQYAFFLSEVFFIKFCKNTFGIKPVDEFTSKFADQVFPLAKSILKNNFPKEYNVLFGNQANTNNLTFFHKTSTSTLYDLIDGADRGGSCIRVAVSSEALACLALIKPFFYDQESFQATFQQLSNSINFRLKQKDYLTQQIAIFEQKQLDALDASVNSFLDNVDLNSLANDLGSLSEDKNFSIEESNFFRAEQLKLESYSSNLLLGPCENVLLITDGDEMQELSQISLDISDDEELSNIFGNKPK